MSARTLLVGLASAGLMWPLVPALRSVAGRLPDPDLLLTPQHLELRKFQETQVHRPRGALMAWTPRAACSFAIELWIRFLGFYGDAERWQKEHPDRLIHTYRIQVMNKLSVGGRGRLEDLSDPKLFKFKIVMNPFHHAVTMYTHAMRNRWGTAHDSDPAFAEILRTFTVQLFGVDDIGNLSFLQFLQTLPLMPHANSNSSIEHYGLQSSELDVAWDLVCQVEQIEDCLARLNTAIDANFTLPPRDSLMAAVHNHDHVSFGQEIANLPYGTWKAMLNNGKRIGAKFPRTEDFFRGSSGANAARWVRVGQDMDFKRFGYSRFAIPSSNALGGRWYFFD